MLTRAPAFRAYDRLSPAYQKFLEGLTATHDGSAFHQVAAAEGVEAYTGVRGHPLNKGPGLTAVHPVIRTNPVTGWKGLFVNGVFTKRINELTKDESDETLKYLSNIVTLNHDLQVSSACSGSLGSAPTLKSRSHQVRHKWSKNDLAIWSNVSTFHSATFD